MPASLQRKVRVGMIGGGPGAFIGGSHRIAMRLDDRYQLVAGVFSRNREKSLAAARELGISEDRVYPDYETMATRETEREDGVDAVAIVTPTDSHYKIAKKLLEAGLNVICDKPLCLSVVEARELQALAEKGELILCLTHNYSGYAMVRHAARLVRNGDLGEVKMVQVEHASGWAAKLLEKQGHTQAAWRMDPALGGEASVLYDLGTHAHQLARFITGLDVSEVAAELSKVVAGREINDNANVLLRFTNGARGSLWVTMAAVGNEHGLRIRVYGERGSLFWHQEDPHHLLFSPIDGPPRIPRKAPNGFPQMPPNGPAQVLGIRRAFSKRSPTSTPRLPTPCSPKQKGGQSRKQSWDFPTLPMASKGSPLSRRRCALMRLGAHGLR